MSTCEEGAGSCKVCGEKGDGNSRAFGGTGAGGSLTKIYKLNKLNEIPARRVTWRLLLV